MNDEEIAKSKTSMKITDEQLVSWETVKGTIVNYIKRHLIGALPNTLSILAKLENEYDLSGQNQSKVFRYKNNVSGIINKILGRSQDWPSSSIFSYIKGNKVFLVTLAGVIEYNKSDVKQTPQGEAYINNAKAHFFNGVHANISICPVDNSNLTNKHLENGDFNGSDIKLFPAVPDNTKIANIRDIKELTTYELSLENTGGVNKYYFSNNSENGISISNCTDNNIVTGSLSCRNNSATNNHNEKCQGTFVNFMPYGDVKIKYNDIDGIPANQFLKADGCGGIYDDYLLRVNTDYIAHDFVARLANAGTMDDGGISEIGYKFQSSLRNMLTANINEYNNDNENGEREDIIYVQERNKDQCYYKIETLFNGKYMEQIIKYDEKGNYLIAEKDLNQSVSDNIYEVQLGNGNLFIGKLTSNEQTGEVYFMEGKFLNHEGKVIDNKKQISLQEASSLLFAGARDVNEDDLKEFEKSSRIIINKGENGYEFTIIGSSFKNTIKNNKVFRDYLPTLEYIKKQIDNVENFLSTEMQALNNQPDNTYRKYIEQKDKDGFSVQLVMDIKQATKELCKKTRESTYMLSDGDKLTAQRLSAFDSQLSQWLYLNSIRNKIQEANVDNTKNNPYIKKVIVDGEKDNIDLTIPTSDEKINTNTVATIPLREKQNIANVNYGQHDVDNKEKEASADKSKDDSVSKKAIHIKEDVSRETQHSNSDRERYPEILNSYDLSTILTSHKANEIASKSQENKAIFSSIISNVVNAENSKIDTFLKFCQLLHKSRGKIDENGAKILPLSQAEYDSFRELNYRLTNTMDDSKDPHLCSLLQEYHIDIYDEYDDIKDDFNQAREFALSGEKQINTALHAQNCKLFDTLDKTGDIKRLCNDILYNRDINGGNINKKYSEHYNDYENQNSLNGTSSFNLEAPYNMLDSGII